MAVGPKHPEDESGRMALMPLWAIVATIPGALLLSSCTVLPDSLRVGDTRVTTTNGVDTAVVTQSGSVWGGVATLVEEVSIGVETGEDSYLFGNVRGVGVGDGRIFVLDAQVHRIRIYDLNGVHLRDVGSEGEGPGEFRQPADLVVGRRVYVRDSRIGRITVFDTTGDLIETWRIEPYFSRRPMVVTTMDQLYVPYRGGMAPWGPERQAGDLLRYPEPESRPPRVSTMRADGAEFARDIPFWPLHAWAMSPTGATVYGSADTYSFTILQHDGTELHIDRGVEPVRVADAEAEWHRSRVVAYMRLAAPDWRWDGPEIPSTKPAFEAFVPAVSGEIWVVREGPGHEDHRCGPDVPLLDPPDTCWKSTRVFDVFANDGRYLGAANVPDGFQVEPRPYIRDDMIVGVVQDERGTTTLKRYRRELSGGG